jgi:hypothetical protein
MLKTRRPAKEDSTPFFDIDNDSKVSFEVGPFTLTVSRVILNGQDTFSS